MLGKETEALGRYVRYGEEGNWGVEGGGYLVALGVSDVR